MLLEAGGHEPAHVCGLQTGHRKEKGASCSGWNHDPKGAPTPRTWENVILYGKGDFAGGLGIKNVEMGRLALIIQMGLM